MSDSDMHTINPLTEKQVERYSYTRDDAAAATAKRSHEAHLDWLLGVTPGQPAYDDEIFGPVASIIKATDDEDAMRLANDSRNDLGGGIFCKDEDRVPELVSKYFDTGMVFINTYNLASRSMPFSGVKDSGYGREHGKAGLTDFANVKAILIGHNDG